MCAIRSGKQSDPRQTVDRSGVVRSDAIRFRRLKSRFAPRARPPRLKTPSTGLRVTPPRPGPASGDPPTPSPEALTPDSHPSRVGRRGSASAARCAMRAAGSQSSKLARWTIYPRGGCTRACHTLRALTSRPESVFLRRGRPGTAALRTSCGAAQSRCSSVHRAPAIFRALSAIPSRTLPKRCHV